MQGWGRGRLVLRSLTDRQEMDSMLGPSHMGLHNTAACHELSWFLQFQGSYMPYNMVKDREA